VQIATIKVHDFRTDEPADPYNEKPVYRHGARAPPTMNPGGIARDEELLDRTQAERAADSVLRPFQLFAQRQASGGLVLLGCAILALAWANSPWAWAYEQMLGVPLGISLGEQVLRLDLRHWINDGLMAIFFFGVGLEIKREFLVGELAERRKAMLPIMSAVGGMVLPALIYAGFNFNGAGAKGWGIPMATDIAFALGVLAVLGSRIPEALKVFLVALAIVDDLGALVVIAIVYTASIEWRGVAVIAAFLLALGVANRIGTHRGSIYLMLGLGLWTGFFMSGLHATLAGVLTALFVPARVKILPGALPQVIHRGADNIEAQAHDKKPEAMHPERVAIIGAIGGTLDAATAPLQRFEHMVQPWVTYGILPAFGLFNAGVVIDATVLRSLPTAVPLGIIVGLVLGKSVGISLASWLAVKTGLAELPEGSTWQQLIGTAFLAGIGFTMALFISRLAFHDTHFEGEAQLAILIGSLLAAVVGITILLTSKATQTPASH
jgi:NhaA family Na+:H+ antiporter